MQGTNSPSPSPPLQQVYLAGMESHPLRLLKNPVHLPAPYRLTDLLRLTGRGLLLVLGDPALTTLRPRVVRHLLRNTPSRLYAVPIASPYPLALRWHAAAGAEILHDDRWEPTVVEAAAAPLRRRLPPESWAAGAKGPDPFTTAVLLLVPHLADLRVIGLARALGLDPHDLCGRCRNRFGLSASALLWAYKRAYARQEIRRGVPPRRVARELGYALEWTLRRAFAIRGETFPVPGAGGRK